MLIGHARVSTNDQDTAAQVAAHGEPRRSSRGRVDVLVNNAGFSQLGTIESVSMESAYRHFEVNVFGHQSLFNNTPYAAV